jgi:hypothetical protein
MDVGRLVRLFAIVLCLADFVPLCRAQLEHSEYNPAAPHERSKPNDGFIDFTLGRINPADRDYGQCLGEARGILFEETVKSGYFWSNLIALSLLGCLFIIVVYQHGVKAKRERTVSDILAQYEQALTRSNLLVEEAVKRNRNLAGSLAAMKQSAARPLAPPAETVDRVPYRPTRSHTSSVHGRTETVSKGNDPKPPEERSANAAMPTLPSSLISLFKPEVELVTKVNALEQQLGHSHEMEKQLRRQLSETGRKLQAEQEKNRSLKGA